MLTLAAWLHDLDPVAFHLGPLQVRWYGLSYLAGFGIGWMILVAMSRRGALRIAPHRVGDAMIAIILGVFVGGRLGYILLYQPSLLVEFTSSPPWWGALAINRGGMASHGGIVGVILACVWIARRERVSALHVLDAVAFVAPVGLLLGRIANFVNGELLGRVVAMPGQPAPWWAVKYPQELLTGHAPPLTPEQADALIGVLDRVSAPDAPPAQQMHALIDAVQSRVPGVGEAVAPLLAARHPSQLYQAAAEGLVLGAALAIVWAKPRRPGVVGAWFLILYGALRIVTEHWRLPDDHLSVQRIAGLSRGQWFSALMIVAGVAAIVLIRRRGAHPPMGGWLRPSSDRPPTETTTP